MAAAGAPLAAAAQAYAEGSIARATGSPAAGARLRDAATAFEAFADRAYTPEGALVSRRLPGAVLHDADEIARRCVAMATGQPVADVDGGALHLSPDSICVHGDTPGAVDIARRVRGELEHPHVPAVHAQLREQPAAQRVGEGAEGGAVGAHAHLVCTKAVHQATASPSAYPDLRVCRFGCTQPRR